MPKIVLPSIWIVIWATIGRSDSSRTARIACSIAGSSEKVSRTNRSTPPSSKALDLLLIHIFGLVERGRAKRLDPQAQRADRTGDKDPIAGGFAGDVGRGDIDLAELAFEAVRLQFMPRRTKRIGLDDVGTGGDIFLVDLADEIGGDEIQLVVAAVDIDALVVEPRADRAVKNVDAVGG